MSTRYFLPFPDVRLCVIIRHLDLCLICKFLPAFFYKKYFEDFLWLLSHKFTVSSGMCDCTGLGLFCLRDHIRFAYVQLSGIVYIKKFKNILELWAKIGLDSKLYLSVFHIHFRFLTILVNPWKICVALLVLILSSTFVMWSAIPDWAMLLFSILSCGGSFLWSMFK